MNRLSGSTRRTCIQCITVVPRSLCRNLIEPIPTAISSRALASLNSPMRIRRKDDDCFEGCFLKAFRGAVARATIPWYLLDYGQHAPSSVDRGTLDPAWLGHASRGNLPGGASAPALDRTAAGRAMGSNSPISPGVRRAGYYRLDDWPLESSRWRSGRRGFCGDARCLEFRPRAIHERPMAAPIDSGFVRRRPLSGIVG